jgi:hypothetical protein
MTIYKLAQLLFETHEKEKLKRFPQSEKLVWAKTIKEFPYVEDYYLTLAEAAYEALKKSPFKEETYIAPYRYKRN